MMAELPLSTYAAWQRYAAREPFGAHAWDLRIGYVLAVIVQALTGERAEPADYVPRWGEPERQDWRTMKAIFDDWKNDAHHRKDKSRAAG